MPEVTDGTRVFLAEPDQYPDQIPNDKIEYNPDPILLGDNSAEVAKVRHLKKQVEHKDIETQEIIAQIACDKIGELLSLTETRADALARINGKLENRFGLALGASA